MSTDESHPHADRVAHLRELIDARVALARLEVQHDIAHSKRLGIVAGTGAVAAIIGLMLLSLVLAEYLAALTQTNPLWWQLGFGIVMVIAGAGAIFFGWRAFRREFSGLTETLDELREDRRWIGEMADDVLRGAGIRTAVSTDTAPRDGA